MAMKLSQLQMLVAVADHGSFSAAAAELDCTQSRISHAIAELERELGTRLLARSHGGSLPTEAGLRVLDKARQMLRLEDSLRACARTDDAIEGRVRVACFRSIGTHLLPYAAEALAARHPGLVLDIDDACNDRLEVIDALRAGRADVGIAQLPVEDGFIVHPYVADDYMLVVPAARRFDAPVTWDQLDGLPFIRLGCSGADAILARCRAAGLVASAERTHEHRGDGGARHGVVHPAAPRDVPGRRRGAGTAPADSRAAPVRAGGTAHRDGQPRGEGRAGRAARPPAAGGHARGPGGHPVLALNHRRDIRSMTSGINFA